MTIDYYGLTDAQKRVAIAKDVLSRVSKAKIIPTSGLYFEPAEVVPHEWWKVAELPAGDLRSTLKECDEGDEEDQPPAAYRGAAEAARRAGEGVT